MGLPVDASQRLQLTAHMRLLFIFALGALALAGCRSPKSAEDSTSQFQAKPARVSPRRGDKPASANPPPRPQPLPRVTPLNEYSGRVVSVNPALKIVVLEFPLGGFPPLDLKMGVYRLGQKLAEIKVTGPSRDQNIAGDILAGEAQVGDEVRGN